VPDGETILIYSRPNTPKLAHISRNPRVALNFDGDGQGGDIILLTGSAVIDPGAPRSDTIAEYQAKYGERIPHLGMTAAGFADAYSVPIRVTLEKLTGF
jgi:PPOX class probable F420-dependent enzyme